MGLISRPTKAVSGTGDFPSGQLARSSEFNGDANTIYAEFNGNVDNANVKSNAGILGSKIASAPNGVGTSQINDLAVTAAKVADATLTKGKVAANELTLAQLNFIVETVTISGVGVSSGPNNYACNPTARPVATLEVVGLYVRRAVVNSGAPAVQVYGPIANDQGTNWAGTLYIIAGGAGNMTFLVTWVFAQKT